MKETIIGNDAIIKVIGDTNSLFISKIRKGIVGVKVDDKYIIIYL